MRNIAFPTPSKATFLVSFLAGFSCIHACSGTAPTPGKDKLQGLNVILITIDTLRADYVSAYGDRAVTPNIDRLADEGTLFEKCIAQAPLTLPSHVTILSGTYPLHHQVRDNGGFMVPGELELMSEVLRHHGYETSAFIAAYVLHSRWGLNQGFDHYADDFNRMRFGTLALQNEKRAEEVIQAAKAWLRAHKDKRFFSWIHLFDPHTPYEPPAAFDKFADDPYRGEVEYVDYALGDLFAFLQDEGLYDKSLIVLTSDHGESLGQHGEQGHGLFVYEPAVWVPLIVRAPFEFPVKRVVGIVEHVDLAPTVLDAIGFPVPESFQGETLVEGLFERKDDIDSIAYTETFYPRLHFGWSELEAIYHDELKYVRAPEEELYRPKSDVEERNNLAHDPSLETQKQAMADRLESFVERQSRDALRSTTASLSREDRQALEALGYATTYTESAENETRADPKEKIDVYNLLREATGLHERGQHDEAIAVAKKVVQAESNLVEAHVLLGNAYNSKKMFREAISSYESVLDLKPDANFTMLDLLSALVQIGEYDQAIEKAGEFFRLFPNDPILHEQLGLAYFFKRDYDRAIDSFRKAIEIEPHPMILTKAGEVLALKGDYVSAESYLRQAVALDPNTKGSYYVLGQIEQARGRPEKAIEYFRKELEVNPLEYRAAYNIAVLLRDQGREGEAISYYRKTIEADPGFNMPYFMIASYFLENDTNLDQAIELCKKGIDVLPDKESTLYGYQTLLRLLVKTGDRVSYELYAAKANELLAEIERQK